MSYLGSSFERVRVTASHPPRALKLISVAVFILVLAAIWGLTLNLIRAMAAGPMGRLADGRRCQVD